MAPGLAWEMCLCFLEHPPITFPLFTHAILSARRFGAERLLAMILYGDFFLERAQNASLAKKPPQPRIRALSESQQYGGGLWKLVFSKHLKAVPIWGVRRTPPPPTESRGPGAH